MNIKRKILSSKEMKPEWKRYCVDFVDCLLYSLKKDHGKDFTESDNLQHVANSMSQEWINHNINLLRFIAYRAGCIPGGELCINVWKEQHKLEDQGVIKMIEYGE